MNTLLRWDPISRTRWNPLKDRDELESRLATMLATRAATGDGGKMVGAGRGGTVLKVPQGSTIYSDQLAVYDGLMTQGYRHSRINHNKAFATGRRRHSNGIENFWGYAKTKLKRFYGIPGTQFLQYLKQPSSCPSFLF